MILGKQMIGGIITWIGYPVVGLSIIWYCIFTLDRGLDGIYYGAIAAVTFNTVLLLMIAFASDWAAYVDESAERRRDEMNTIYKSDVEMAKLAQKIEEPEETGEQKSNRIN